MNTKLSVGRKITNAIITIVLLMVVGCIAFIIINRVTFFSIVGNSMNPTLKNNELVLAMPRKEYKRGDIVSFENKGETAIKRIVGIPGDKVYINEIGEVYINDELLEEKYVKELYQGDIEIANPYTLQEDEYYVLGDNRMDSKDSRLLTVGALNKSQIKEKVYFSLSKVKVIK